ncbi:MAG TPA: hypothetical protein VHG09_10595 [Longimicrobiales bacterium]|nr:hypothetical protein [Longimicrobiales bacterium]
MKYASITRILSPLAIAAIIAACSGGDAGDTDTTTPPPATQPTGQSAAAASAAAIDEIGDYRLTMPAVRRWYEAQAHVYRAIGKNPELVDELEMLGQVSDIDEMEAHFDGIPEWRDAVGEAGLDMRDYAAILITLYHAKAVDEAIQSGADRAQVTANQQVDPANLEFVEQNRDELERLERELAELGGGRGGAME